MSMRKMVSIISAASLNVASFGWAGEQPPIVTEGRVHASVDDVWAAFTTKEGIESWMTPHAEIELRVGGLMRTNYHRDGVIGDAETIENTILSFDPKRMLSIRATKAPEGFPFKGAIANSWTVIYFEPQGPDLTNMRIVMLGYTDDEESQQMRKHFEWGNDWTLKKLQEKFGGVPLSSSEAATSQAEAEAERYFVAEDWSKAAEAYRALTDRNAANALAWRRLGFALHMLGRLDEALAAHRKAAEFPEARATALFNVACVHALRNEKEEAFAALESAIDAGFADREHVQSDPDLASLHADPRFQSLLTHLDATVTKVEAPREIPSSP